MPTFWMFSSRFSAVTTSSPTVAAFAANCCGRAPPWPVCAQAGDAAAASKRIEAP